MYGLLRSLTAPKAPKESSFKELLELLKAHFKPAPIVIAERYRYHCRDQAAGESIGDYVAELCRLTAHCHFEATTKYQTHPQMKTEIFTSFLIHHIL